MIRELAAWSTAGRLPEPKLTGNFIFFMVNQIIKGGSHSPIAATVHMCVELCERLLLLGCSFALVGIAQISFMVRFRFLILHSVGLPVVRITL